MGLPGHQRPWRYGVLASPERCIERFMSAFSRGGGFFARADWELRRDEISAVAVFQGHKGLAALATRRSRAQRGQIGSQVTFEVEEVAGNQTVCAMWLSDAARGNVAGDARFARDCMRAVELRLRELDPAVRMTKD
jgi:hypothetical protein